MNVLVVEDDPSVRETLALVLEAYQHKPVLARDGEEAMTLLKAAWPDVILLDLSLPGMSGEEVYWKIHSTFGKVPPTVVLSAVQKGENRIRGLPGTLFLAKPYTLEELADSIAQVAGRRGAA